MMSDIEQSWEGWLCMNSNSPKSFPIPNSLFIPFLFPVYSQQLEFVDLRDQRALTTGWLLRGLDKSLPLWNILTPTLRGVWKSWKFFPTLCACGIFGKSQNSSWEHSELVHISLGIPFCIRFLFQITNPGRKTQHFHFQSL